MLYRTLFLSCALIAPTLAHAPLAHAAAHAARARAAHAAGRIVALERIAAAAAQHTGGVVLDVELEDDDDDHARPGQRPARLISEVKALAADGRIVKLEYDAETGALLREKSKRRGKD